MVVAATKLDDNQRLMTSAPMSARIPANAARANGLNVGTAAPAIYVKPFGNVPENPAHTPPLVTTTSTGPAAWAGVVAVIWSALRTTTLVAATPPKVTVDGLKKLVPLIVTDVPPAL